MKKILISFLFIFLLSLNVFAKTKDEIFNTFNDFVQDANNYNENMINYYTQDAKIYRIVNKKSGGKYTTKISFERYKQELNKNMLLAKTIKYKNNYIKQKIKKIDKNNYILSAKRIPRNDKTELPCYYIFTKTQDGWKIKEESLTTNVQAFISLE